MIKRLIKRHVPPTFVRIYRKSYNIIVPILYFLKKENKRHLYAGIPLTVYIYDPVSALWYDHDVDRYEIKFLERYNLKEGATVFNIGAHHGVIALILAKIMGKTGLVVAAEMNANHVGAAKINKRNNKASNLRIIHAAASEKRGTVFYSADQILKENVHDRNVTKIESVTVDELTQIYGQPSVLYIDVEGYEYRVLRGARKTIRKYTPDCCIEVHVNQGLENFDGTIEKIVSFFPQNQYSLFMAPAIDKCHFTRFRYRSKITNNRFYLVTVARDE